MLSGDDPNMIGPVFHDEELFASKKVYHIGQMIGMIIATTEVIARSASKLVKIQYEKLPAIFTIEEALEKNSIFKSTKSLLNGWYSGAGVGHSHKEKKEGLHFVEGSTRISGQEHFYLGIYINYFF